jgi:hypothetical protein
MGAPLERRWYGGWHGGRLPARPTRVSKSATHLYSSPSVFAPRALNSSCRARPCGSLARGSSRRTQPSGRLMSCYSSILAPSGLPEGGQFYCADVLVAFLSNGFTQILNEWTQPVTGTLVNCSRTLVLTALVSPSSSLSLSTLVDIELASQILLGSNRVAHERGGRVELGSHRAHEASGSAQHYDDRPLCVGTASGLVKIEPLMKRPYSPHPTSSRSVQSGHRGARTACSP